MNLKTQWVLERAEEKEPARVAPKRASKFACIAEKDPALGMPGAESTVVTAKLSSLNDWYFQAGANAMSATAGSQTAFMLGWNGADTLTCAAANDPTWRMAA